MYGSFQEEFDMLYISSREIAQTLQVSRTTVSTFAKSKLPEPIRIEGTAMLFWPRRLVKSEIDRYKEHLDNKRANENAR